jgi:hypothetical protein
MVVLNKAFEVVVAFAKVFEVKPRVIKFPAAPKPEKGQPAPRRPLVVLRHGVFGFGER